MSQVNVVETSKGGGNPAIAHSSVQFRTLSCAPPASFSWVRGIPVLLAFISTSSTRWSTLQFQPTTASPGTDTHNSMAVVFCL